MAQPLIACALSRPTAGSVGKARVLDFPLTGSPAWGFTPVVGEIPARSEAEFAATDVSDQPITRVEDGAERARPTGGEWIGSEPRTVAIDGVGYALTYVFLGSGEGEDNSHLVDPRLLVAEVASAADLPCFLTTYDEFDAGTRTAFLEWVGRGRVDAAVPIAFAIHLVHSLETALFKKGRHELAATAAAELERMVQLFSDDEDLRACAEPLIDACRLIDPETLVDPVHAGARANFGKEMPFRVRRFLAQEVHRSHVLEADPALLLLLQQPETHLDAHVAGLFNVLYHHWTENYSYRFNGGVELQPTAKLCLTYDCMDGLTSVEIASELPDVASAPLPADLRQFFDECCAELEALRNLPVAQQNAMAKRLGRKTHLRGYKPQWSLRPDFEERVFARVSQPQPILLAARDLLSDLFEATDLPANKQLPGPARKQMQRALSSIGVGFEPDDRFGLPARIRPGTQLALFPCEPTPCAEPSDAFCLAQAAMVLSAIGTSTFAELRPICAADVEPRLPYIDHYSDDDLKRLQATFLFMQNADRPRELLKSWPRRMKRLERLKDIDRGFGIAFHAQAGSPFVKRFATAVSKALHSDDRRVASFLQEVEEQARLDAEQGAACAANSLEVVAQNSAANDARSIGEAAASSNSGPSTGSSYIEGLPAVLVEIIEALVRGPCSRTELNQIALTGQMQLAGALEQLNEWSLLNLKAHLTRGNHPVRINPVVFDAVELIVRQK